MGKNQTLSEEAKSNLSVWNRLFRAIWYIVWILLFRPSPRPFFGWRRFLLRLFGAKIAEGVHVYGSDIFFYPPNLIMDAYSVLGSDVDCYCVNKIHIGHRAVVSQYSFLCTASHDYRKSNLPLITSPIKIENNAWIAADSFIGPGITIGEGAVVGARSSVYRDVPPWVVVGGNPATKLKNRVLDNNSEGH
jgi:putative colanic acid biosynthesis acetyltransferase WcaF